MSGQVTCEGPRGGHVESKQYRAQLGPYPKRPPGAVRAPRQIARRLQEASWVSKGGPSVLSDGDYKRRALQRKKKNPFVGVRNLKGPLGLSVT